MEAGKYQQGPSIEPLLAERVTITYQHAADEAGSAPQVLARPDAAKALVATVEGFLIGDRQTCDARCCKFDPKGQHGDMVSAVASVCFDHDLVSAVDAIP